MSELLDIDDLKHEFSIANYHKLIAEVRRLCEVIAEKDRQLEVVRTIVLKICDQLEWHKAELAAASGGTKDAD